MKRLAPILAIAALSACTQPEEATRTLEGAGYTQIQITGYEWIGCSRGEVFSTGFEAAGLNGKRVSGTVCSGVLKGYTIRTN